MLESVRKPSRAKGFLAYFIFGAIIVVFIGFGVVPDRLSNEATGVAAVVNHSQISLADFRNRLQNLERQYQSRMDQVPPSERQRFNQAIRQRAMDDLIQFEVLAQAARERGITVTDEEIRDFIVQIPSFREEDRFKRQNYERYLAQAGMSAGQFEDKIRKDLIVRKVQVVFQESLKPSTIEQDLDNRSQKIKINLEVASFAPEDLAPRIPVSAGEIQAYLAVKENQDKIKKIYEENAVRYSEPEQVRARHILIGVDRNKPGSDAEAKGKIEALTQRSEKEDFAKLAKENSEDPGSKEKGGDLGFFSRGRMVPEFESAAFSGEPGKIVGPIRTDFGYHLIKVEEKKAPVTKTFDEVKNEIAKVEIGKTKVAALEERLSQLVAKKDEAGLKKELKGLGVGWDETGDFTMDVTQIPKLADPDKAIEAVLKSGVKRGLVPEVIKAEGRTYLLGVKSFTNNASAPDPLGDYVSSRKHYDAFNSWAKAAFSEANIKRNSAIITAN
jgi:parvulin-like peptidyl-prolyl isomerase